MLYLFTSQLGEILTRPEQEFPFTIDFIFAFLFTLYGTGIFAFAGFSYPTSKLIGSTYYKLKNPKRLKTVYTLFGVKYFKYLLLLFFWGTKKNRKKYFNGTKTGLKDFIYQTHQSEFGHLGALILLVITSSLLVWRGYFEMSLIVSAVNFVGNLYPIILQRYHRIRIEKLISDRRN